MAVKPQLINILSTYQNNKKDKNETMWFTRRWMHKEIYRDEAAYVDQGDGTGCAGMMDKERET